MSVNTLNLTVQEAYSVLLSLLSRIVLCYKTAQITQCNAQTYLAKKVYSTSLCMLYRITLTCSSFVWMAGTDNYSSFESIVKVVLSQIDTKTTWEGTYQKGGKFTIN